MLKFRKIYLLLAFIVLSILIKTTTIQAQQDVITDYRSGEWSPDNRFIALFDVTGEDHSFRIFSGDLEPVASLRLDDLSTNEVELRGLAWSPDGTKLATIFFASGDPLVRDTYIAIWETQTWTEVQRFRDIGLLVTWSPDGQHIATGNSIWDAATGELIQTFSGFRSISYVAWHPTNINQVLVASRGTAFILDVITGRDIAAHPYNEITAPVFSSDGQYLALHQTYDPNLNVTAVDILDTSTYQLVSTIEYFGSLNERDGLSWRGNEAIVLEYIFAGADIVDITTAQVVDTISINQRNVWSDDGSRFLASGETFIDGRPSMAVFDAETESIIAQLASPTAVSALKITDGTGTDLETLLAGMNVINQVPSGDGIVRLIQALTYPEDTISVAFDLNGTVIIDNTAPYTIPLPSVGEYILTATPYTQPDAQGDSGLALTVNVDVSSATASCDATVSASDVSGLVSAINTANGSSGADTICLEASTYALNAVQNNNYGPNGLPAITSELTLVGLGGGATIERAGGSPSFRFFRVTSGGTLTLENLTLSGGDESNGGAIYNEGTLTLEGTTLQNNTGGRGGGIRNDGGTVTLTDSTISGNTVTNEGGGVYSTSSLTLTNTTLSNNSADDGGGIYNTGGTVNISGGTISGNDATGRGGGIRSFNGGSLIISNGAVIDGNDADIDGGGVYAESTVTITDSTISGNNAVNGGGIYSRSGTLTLIDSTVSLNNNDPANPSSVTSISGGGIYNFAGNVSVMDTLIDDNAVGNDGAGIYNATDTLTVTRSVISNNNAGSRSGGIENRGIADITLTRIENNTSVSQGGGMFNTGTATLTDSCVMGNTSTNSTGVGSSVSMDAEHVWWGDASGPGGWAGGSGDGIGTSVSALPYLENGCYEPRTSTVIANLAVASSRDYDLHSFQLGARAYTDRTYSFNQVPNELSALIGAVYVRPSQNDKAVSSPADFMTFSLEQNATLYVLWDNRLPTPSWLSTWTDTGHDITTTDSGGSLPRSVFSQSFNAGQVTLPPPTGTTNSTTYMVVAVPQ